MLLATRKHVRSFVKGSSPLTMAIGMKHLVERKTNFQPLNFSDTAAGPRNNHSQARGDRGTRRSETCHVMSLLYQL